VSAVIDRFSGSTKLALPASSLSDAESGVLGVANLEVLGMANWHVKITPATATLSVGPSEDGKAWQAQFTWDDGRVDRVLRFERKEDAEAWISLYDVPHATT
jgi:hypothetical protein